MLDKDKCENRIDERLEKEIAELERMYYAEDEETQNEFFDYGLDYSYVAPNTFEDQDRGYYRWQLSWGGPSDEFRFYHIEDGNEIIDARDQIIEIEYVFMDWFDGAERKCTEENHPVIFDIAQNYLSLTIVKNNSKRNLY